MKTLASVTTRRYRAYLFGRRAQKLSRAQAAEARHNLPEAATRYDDAWVLVQSIGTGVDEEREQTRAGLGRVRLELARNAQKAGHLRDADKQIKDLGIKTPSRRSLASSMSGGNQQKIVIGKWLNHGADLFIFDEPTVGVDVGTKAEIYRLLAELLKKGAGIIMISSYLPEVYELADTLHVFRTGHLVGSNAFHQSSHEEVLAEAIGV